MKNEFDLVVESYCKEHGTDKEMLLSHVWELYRLFEDEERLMKGLVMYPDEFYSDVGGRQKLESYLKGSLYSKLFDYYSKRLAVFTEIDIDSVKEHVELRLGSVV